MIELQVVLQVLAIIALLLFIGVLVYVFYLLGKVNKKLDTIIEILTYYERVKSIVTDFANGPGKLYLSIFQSVMSYVTPLLTRRKKNN